MSPGRGQQSVVRPARFIRYLNCPNMRELHQDPELPATREAITVTKTQEDPSGRESDPVTALRRLSLSDMPGFEILLLDEFAGWTFSVGNTGHGYLDKHAEMLAGTLLRAADRAGSFSPPPAPADLSENLGYPRTGGAGAPGIR